MEVDEQKAHPPPQPSTSSTSPGSIKRPGSPTPIAENRQPTPCEKVSTEKEQDDHEEGLFNSITRPSLERKRPASPVNGNWDPANGSYEPTPWEEESMDKEQETFSAGLCRYLTMAPY